MVAPTRPAYAFLWLLSSLPVCTATSTKVPPLMICTDLPQLDSCYYVEQRQQAPLNDIHLGL